MPEAKRENPPTKPLGKASVQPPQKGVSIDLIGTLILTIVTLNLAAVGGLGYFMQKMWLHLQEVEKLAGRASELTHESESTGETSAPNLGKELHPQHLGNLIPLDSFLVNIPSEQGTKFLQASMELELSDPALEDEITRKKAAVRDAIIVILTSRHYRDLKDKGGIKKLRTDLAKSINNLLSTGKIKEIYFTQFHFN